MITCKECIHFADCLDIGKTRYYGRENACGDVDKRCKFFKNKTNFVEIRHGEWIWKELYGEIGLMLVCSECEESEGACERFDYCPNCGAKMDGGN